MHTLHEFYVVTKGQEYLIAVGFLLLFPLVWRLVAGPKRGNRNH
jgi:hypothetical protein